MSHRTRVCGMARKEEDARASGRRGISLFHGELGTDPASMLATASHTGIPSSLVGVGVVLAVQMPSRVRQARGLLRASVLMSWPA